MLILAVIVTVSYWQKIDIRCPPVVWNHTLFLITGWNLCQCQCKAPLTAFKRPLAARIQSVMVDHYCCPAPVSLLSREHWFPQLSRKQCGSFVLITFSCELSLYTNCHLLPERHRLASKMFYAVFVRAIVLPKGYMGINWRQSYQKKTGPFTLSRGGLFFSWHPEF